MLQRLVDGGNTVVIIEHHMDVVKNVDHIIDLGPMGGERGGKIVAEGTPEQVAQVEKSQTGQYLRRALGARRPPAGRAGNGRRDGRATATAASNAKRAPAKGRR